MRELGTLMGWVVALGLCAIAIVCFIAPAAAVRAYGLPLASHGDRWLVTAAGARDLAIGLLVVAALVKRERAGLRRLLLLATVVPIADAAIVASHVGLANPVPLAMHAGGAGFMLAAVKLL